jgi:hypothetical protein
MGTLMAALMAALAFGAAGCKARVNSPADGGAAAQAYPEPALRYASLSLEGYNYTDRYIDTYSVNGQGGGNVRVSGPASGGGGGVCCLKFLNTGRARKVTVRWQHGACLFTTRSTNSPEVYPDNLHSFMKEVEVMLDEPVPANPKYIETHFYPDGSVRVALTEEASAPRLVLDKKRENTTAYSRCPDDKKPSS